MLKIAGYISIFLISVSISLANNEVAEDSIIQNLNIKSDLIKFNNYMRLGKELYLTDYQKSITYLQNAVGIAQNMSDSKKEAKAYYEIGKTYDYHGCYQDGMKNILQSLRISESINDTINIGNCYKEIGNIYSKFNKYDEALNQFKKAYDIYNSINYKEGVGRALFNMGNIYYFPIKDSTKAIEYYSKGLEIVKESGINDLILTGYNNLGNLYRNYGNYEKALEYFNKGLRSDCNDPYFRELIKINLGIYHLDLKQYDKALPILLESYKKFKENKYLDQLPVVTRCISKTYAGLHEYEQAYKYRTIYNKLNDSIFSKKTLQEINNLNKQYEYEKVVKENQLLRLKQDKKAKINLLMYISSSMLIILIVLIIYYRQKTKIRQGKLEKVILKNDLDYKNKTLVIKALFLTKTNQFISTELQKLKFLKKNLKKENEEYITNIINELQGSIKENTWEEFEAYFNETHIGFNDNLNNKFPSLTKNEKKLCSLLRMNLSTKEIANILHKKVDSIRIARMRLRKKLRIDNEAIDLINFLLQF